MTAHFPRARRLVALFVAIAALPLALACGSRAQEDPILRLSAAESLAEGKRLLEQEKYAQARKYLSHAFEVEPNSVSGREALLLVADSLFLQKGTQNLVQAEAKYRDFLNRFPTSERAPYVQFQIGNALAARVERPDRDQSVTLQAMRAFEELLRLYPTSEHAETARQKVVELRSHLAEHEFQVGRFYLRFGLPKATVERLAFLLDNYPEFTDKDKVYYYLGLAHQELGEAKEASEWFQKLRQEYPASSYVAEIPAEGRATG